MAEDVIIIGAGGFGREVADVIEAVNASAADPVWNLVGIVDDSPSETNLERLTHRSIEYLGSLAAAMASQSQAHYLIGIGNPDVRRDVAQQLDQAGFMAATLVHPAASLGSHVSLGSGTIVCAGVRVTTNITIGRHVHLNLNSTIGHDSTVGDYVSVNPLASISGDCVLEDSVLIGVSASVINGRTVEAGSIVGGGACVVKDVRAGSTVAGVPAKPLIRH